ncbi:MAG TPA: hypothetical protein VE779_05060 [Candidatus Angelobacter sp.]|nr:hypothetical protein [Candidatus Angelobacter sp.]
MGGDPTNVKTYVNNNTVLSGGFAIAFDALGKVWLTSSNTNLIIQVDSNTGNYQTYSLPGVAHPLGIAIDSAGMIWVANLAGQNGNTLGSVVAFDPSTGTFGPPQQP